MTYDPDRRYAHDLEALPIARPLPEQVASERGQFWNVERSIRGRWTGTGAGIGFAVTHALYEYDVLNVVRSILGMNLIWSLILAYVFGLAAGAALGYFAASMADRIRRGLTT